MKQVPMSHKNKKRFFAFGCSFTKYAYATWADLIGPNFQEYYNYGKGGASNTYIMNRIVEASQKFSFNPETDIVMVGLTGFGRFSYFKGDFGWRTDGEVRNYVRLNPGGARLKNFVDEIWDENWGVYSSWIALKTIQQILNSSGVSYEIFHAIDNSDFVKTPEVFGLTSDTVHLAKEFISAAPVCFHCWMQENYTDKDIPVWWDNGDLRRDGHPSQKMHYDFVKQFYPQFDTEVTQAWYSQYTKAFTNESQHIQGEKFRKSFSIDLSNKNTLFGE
jgi:hypothetical protein